MDGQVRWLGLLCSAVEQSVAARHGARALRARGLSDRLATKAVLQKELRLL
jgi:predicted N-formylglutamate amidohydrolase